MKKEENNENESNIELYEIGYLLIPNISDEEVLTEVANIKAILEKNEAVFLSGDEPRLINLAYSISKIFDGDKQTFDKAYFAWMKFKIENDKLADFKKELNKYKNILRHLLVKTVEKDNLVADIRKNAFVKNKKNTTSQEEKVIKPVEIVGKDFSQDGAEEKTAITEEKKKEDKELDETIDNLIIK
ncbi:MAG: 30S ribosomal protein S6 [Patescibacteria group bacterium]